jgi:hypothetical protein
MRVWGLGSPWCLLVSGVVVVNMSSASAHVDSRLSGLAVLAAVALGLSAGAMLAEGAVMVPYWRSLAPDTFLRWYAENGSRLLAFFGPLEIAGAVLALAAAALSGIRRAAGIGLLVVASALALAVLAPFPIYFRDVNASFAAATIAPDQVGEELARWAVWHWFRTVLGIGAFVAAVLAVRRTAA